MSEPLDMQKVGPVAPPVRPALPADASMLTELALRAKAHWGYSAELLELWRPQLTITPEIIERQSTWVCEDCGSIRGFCSIESTGDSAELEHLWVDPDAMGRGIGRALLVHALAEARACGVRSLRAESDPHAAGFYLRMGASPAGEADSTPTGRKLPVLSFDLPEGLWAAFLDSDTPEARQARDCTYTAWQFGSGIEQGNRLAECVVTGPKRATAGSLWAYEAEGEELPAPGDYSVVLDGYGVARCVIRTTSVHITPFEDVDAAFAYDEGEGDRSLAYWRDVHWRYFTAELAAMGMETTLEMPVVCERFEVVFRR